MNEDQQILEIIVEEILNESNASHGNKKEIEKLLDIVREVNKYLKEASMIKPSVKPHIAKIETRGNVINFYPNDDSGQFLSFHDGGDHHPLRRAMRRLFNSEINLLKQYVDRKFFRQYIQPVLTGT